MAAPRRRPAVTYREEPCRSALNRVSGMPFSWSLNPYSGCAHRCTFCYVRAFERRADRPSGDDYGRSVRVKVNVAGVLRAELSRASWRQEIVCVGAATDPYQPAEGRYRLTRACLEAFADHRTPVTLITRGTLVVRDVDVMQRLARVAGLQVTISLPSLDPAVVARTEPGTPPPASRLRALATLVDAGVAAGVAMAPLLPGISDSEAEVERVARAARNAGATFLWGGVLHLQPGTREHFLTHLATDYPEHARAYERLYAGRAYLPAAVSDPIAARVERARRSMGVADRRPMRMDPLPRPRQLDLIAV